MISEEVLIDHRVHSRLIGAKGRAISKIMDEYKVDVRMPGRDAEHPDLVIITGLEADVQDCQEHLRNLEEEYVGYRCFVLASFVYHCYCSPRLCVSFIQASTIQVAAIEKPCCLPWTK